MAHCLKNLRKLFVYFNLVKNIDSSSNLKFVKVHKKSYHFF